MNVHDPGPHHPRVWVLADDRAGNRAQCLGVAEALGCAFQTKDIAYGPAAALPNAVLGATFAGLSSDSRRALVEPWPDLVIAAGRRTAPVARAVKRRSGGRSFLAQIMDPGPPGRGEFDLIAVPRHDRLPPADNRFETIGAPHRVSRAILKRAEAQWRPRFEALPPPRIALLVGGATRRRPFTAADGRTLGRRASVLAAQAGGSLLVSTSARTGPAAESVIDAVEGPSHVYRWDDGGENPYLGYLACADAVIVTGESMSMCSEACANTGPVYVYAPPGSAAAKHERFHRELFELGYARPLGDRLETWSHPPLDPAGDVAAEIRARLGLDPPMTENQEEA